MWKDDLNEENKGSPALKDIGEDVNDLVKSFINSQQRLGDSIRIPSSEASPEDVTAFHQRLIEKVPGLIPTPDGENPETIDIFLSAMGKPKDKDGYTLPDLEGIDVNDIRAELIRSSALEQGLTQKQLNGFLTKMYEADLEGIDNSSQVVHQDQLDLKREWGVTHANRIKALTDNMLLSEAPAGLTDALKNKQLDSGMIKWLDSIFSKFSEEGGELGKHEDEGKGGDDVVPTEAAERANEIRKKLSDPSTPKVGPEYDALLSKLVKYESMAHPGSSTNINDLRAGVRSG